MTRPLKVPVLTYHASTVGGPGYDQNDQVAEMPVTFAVNGWASDATPN